MSQLPEAAVPGLALLWLWLGVHRNGRWQLLPAVRTSNECSARGRHVYHLCEFILPSQRFQARVGRELQRLCLRERSAVHRGDHAQDNPPKGWLLAPLRSDATGVALQSGRTVEPVRGYEAGEEGDGYCTAGYRGPRCELCNGTADYFDKDDARCHSCGDVTAKATAVYCVFLLLFFTAIGSGAAIMWRPSFGSKRIAMLKLIRRFQTLWRRAGLHQKVKAAIGLFQCVGAVPTVMDVTAPPGLSPYTRGLNVIEFSADVGIQTVIPSTCFGSYRSQMLISALWPIILLLVAAAGFGAWELAKTRYVVGFAARRTTAAAMYTGLQRTLPLTLLLTFCLVPSVGTRIFKTFLYAAGTRIVAVGFISFESNNRCSDLCATGAIRSSTMKPITSRDGISTRI
jgi:hypothetical protein